MHTHTHTHTHMYTHAHAHPRTPTHARTLAADFDHETLGPFISRDGAFGETAFFHKDTKTLLVTDTVVQVSHGKTLPRWLGGSNDFR